MKRLFLLIALCITLLSCSKRAVKSNIAPEFRPADVHRVAVLPFRGDRGDVLSDIFTTELMKLHLFDIVGSATLEQGRHEAGEAPQGSGDEEGEVVSPPLDLEALSVRFNLDAVITGNVAIDFNMLVINTRLMEMETGNLLWSTSYICECGRVNISDLEEAVRDTVEELERALSTGP